MLAENKLLPWFVLAYGVFIVNDVLFIRSSDWQTYLAVDYGSRVLALALLLVPRAPRAVVLQREPRRVGLGQAILLVLACVTWERVLAAGVLPELGLIFGNSRLANFPVLPPGIKQLDLVLGVLLVAISEEVLSRRVARVVLRDLLRGDFQVIVVSALLFAAIHWSQGIPNLVYVFLIGVVFMAVYLRVGALWPLILAHYIIDVIAFW
jgi:membrane protease YdiL (CAAX protease family)